MQPLPYKVPSEGTPEARQLESALPSSLKSLRAYVSLETIVRLIESHGGVHVYIPSTAVKDSALAKIIGLEPAKTLSHVLAKSKPERLLVPRASRFRAHLRNMEIVRRSDLGETSSSLARDFGLSQRQIFKVLEDFR
jgi:Mor family transcriptional regulator